VTTLYEATKDLHHACEQHDVGKRMVTGAVTPQEWANWLWSFRVLHEVVDFTLPDHMARNALLSADLSVLPRATPSRTALHFAASLVGADTTGAAYVLHGAHRSGGRVLAPKMVKRGLPTAHTSYLYADDVQAWLGATRSAVEHTQQARDTFLCLLGVMDEIGALTE